MQIAESSQVKKRIYAAGAVLSTIVVGLASRKYPGIFPAVFGKYPGDVLWAQMVYWILRFVFPSQSIPGLAIWALLISYADELSQLYQAAWVRHIRATAIGHLVLGSAFSWRDLLAYTVGVALCAGIELLIHRLCRKDKI